jgi:hypothetical protein
MFAVYRSDAWRRLSRATREAGSCAVCGIRSAELAAHHREPVLAEPARAFDSGNVVALCADCHRAAHDRLKGGGVGFHRDAQGRRQHPSMALAKRTVSENRDSGGDGAGAGS